jgi:hypothetical protein
MAARVRFTLRGTRLGAQGLELVRCGWVVGSWAIWCPGFAKDVRVEMVWKPRRCFGGARDHPSRAKPCHSGSCSGLPRASNSDVVRATEMELKSLRFAVVGSAPETKERARSTHHHVLMDLTVSGESLRFSSVPRDLFPSNGEGQEGDG